MYQGGGSEKSHCPYLSPGPGATGGGTGWSISINAGKAAISSILPNQKIVCVQNMSIFTNRSSYEYIIFGYICSLRSAKLHGVQVSTMVGDGGELLLE